MRNLFYTILSWFSVPFFFFYRNRLRVIAYHTVNDKVSFENQLRYIFENFNVISSQDLKQFLQKMKPLPKNSVLITFDDGDVSVLENAIPLLEKYNLPAILFVITDLIDSTKPFWWYEIEQLVDKKIAYSKVWEVKKIPNAERVVYLEELRTANPNNVNQNQLTTRELKLMHSKNVTIANHSHTHPMFDKSTRKELQSEMALSNSFLKENKFDHELFAYPNGNFDIQSEEILKESTIKYAFLFDHRLNKKAINPLRISRIRVNSDANLDEFKTKILGLHPILYHFNFIH